VSRDLPVDLQTEIAKPVLQPFLAVRIELPDPVYAFTGLGTMHFADADGVERAWIGAGELGAIDTVGEATDGSATGIKVSLLQVPAEFRDDIADQAVRGALFEVYVGALSEDFTSVVATALIWKGRVDQYKITDGGSALAVEVTGESRAIDQRRPAIKRFTDEYQQRQHPGDKFFEYVPRMTEVSILWGKAEQSAVASGGSGGGGAGGFAGNNSRSKSFVSAS
jgi:hypothetical protein